MKTTLERVTEVLYEELGSKDIKPEHRIREDLNMDSLYDIEIIMALEEEFEIEIDDDEVTDIKTVADIVAFIDKKLIA